MQSPLEHSPERITLLGIITARWATLDAVLVLFLSKLLRDDIITAETIYFSSSSGRARFDQLRALIAASRWPAEDKDTSASFIDDAAKLWQARNDLVHSYATSSGLTPDATFNAEVIRPQNGKKKFKKVALTVNYLQDHADKLSSIGDRVSEFTFREHFRMIASLEPQASPETPASRPRDETSP